MASWIAAAKDAISHRGQAVRAIVPVLIDELRRWESDASRRAEPMKTYLDLLDHVLTHGVRRSPTGPAPARSACSATRCAST